MLIDDLQSGFELPSPVPLTPSLLTTLSPHVTGPQLFVVM
jgi:hypothetical protein